MQKAQGPGVMVKSPVCPSKGAAAAHPALPCPSLLGGRAPVVTRPSWPSRSGEWQDWVWRGLPGYIWASDTHWGASAMATAQERWDK